jgi:hypothetical protein
MAAKTIQPVHRFGSFDATSASLLRMLNIAGPNHPHAA